MAVTPELLTAVFQGAVLIFGALGITAAQRSNRASVRVRDHRALQNRHLAALSLIYVHEQDRAIRGLPRIPRPPELERTDDEHPPPPGPTPVPAGA